MPLHMRVARRSFLGTIAALMASSAIAVTPARRIAALGGHSDGHRAPPSGFTATIPFGFKVYRTPGTRTFTTNIILSNPLNPTSAAKTVYVDRATGNDSNAGTNSGSPKATISSGLTALNGQASGLLMVKGGRYSYAEGWAGNSPTCQNLSVVSWDGNPVYITVDQTQSWSSVDGTTYSATIAGFSAANVWDATNLTSDGDYGLLTLASSQANCQATANSYFISGTTYYVHTFDGRAPDSNIHVLGTTIGGGNGIYEQPLGALYMENLHFQGGTYGFLGRNAAAQSSGPDLYVGGTIKALNCSFKYSQGDACLVAGSFYTLYQNCVAAWAVSDGFSRHHNAPTNPPGFFIEINCIGRYCGKDNTGANNGSTNHDGSSGIRVSGYYHHNQDRNVHDVGGGASWNLGCRSSTNQNASTNANWQSGTASTGFTMYLDCCDSDGSANDLNVDVGAFIYCNEFVGDSTAVTAAGGTIALYDPDNDPVSAPSSLVSLFGVGDKGYLYDLRDGSTLYTANTATAVALNGGIGKVVDQSGNGNHLLQTALTKCPLKKNDATGYYAQFDGSNDYLSAAFSSVAMPFTRISLLRIRTYTTGRYIFEGKASGDAALEWMSPSPKISQYGGSTVNGVTPPATGTLLCVAVVHGNGTSSFVEVNGTRVTGGNPGTAATDAIVWADSISPGHESAIDVYAQIGINRVLSAGEITTVKANYGF